MLHSVIAIYSVIAYIIWCCGDIFCYSVQHLVLWRTLCYSVHHLVLWRTLCYSIYVFSGIVVCRELMTMRVFTTRSCGKLPLALSLDNTGQTYQASYSTSYCCLKCGNDLWLACCVPGLSMSVVPRTCCCTSQVPRRSDNSVSTCWRSLHSCSVNRWLFAFRTKFNLGKYASSVVAPSIWSELPTTYESYISP